tara:strand:- start:524 stop:943 length:420 start_codon:yes stop_codon:yes gene_type:complete
MERNFMSITNSSGPFTDSMIHQLVEQGTIQEPDLYNVYLPYKHGTIFMGSIYIAGEPTGEELQSFDWMDLMDTVESLEHDCSGDPATADEFLNSYQVCLRHPEFVEFHLMPREKTIVPPGAWLIEELVQEQLEQKSQPD